MTTETKARFSSKWGFILATTGAAVGLGNIWRFPYMVGIHGGSAFVLLYGLFVLLIGAPIMLAELMIGRIGRRNPVDSLSHLASEAGKSRAWGAVGWLGALALLMILSFYSVVSGWAIAYFGYAVTNVFQGLDPHGVHELWGQFISQPAELTVWHSIFMFLTMGVISCGVKNGLERATCYMMPLLYLLLFFLVGYSAIHGNFAQACHFLFDFQWKQVDISTVIAALGHAFFTLAIGAGAILTYGAYVKDNVNLCQSVGVIIGLDVLVAFLSGLAIFPLVFAKGLAPAEGPGLMFEALPIAFSQLPAGQWLGAGFFLLLIFAAWTSSINIAEPMVMILIERGRLTRTQACWVIGGLAWFMGLGTVLSFNIWQDVRLFGHWSLFDIATSMPTDLLLPLGGFGFSWFVVHIMNKKDIFALLVNNSEVLQKTWWFLLRFLAPLAILVILLSGLIG